ncbi:MAG: purine-nucleoside phosphorylase [Clostridiales bacterium]|nr:purine-nucleoside phosphorylase [Candidatus Crickella caballi]
MENTIKDEVIKRDEIRDAKEYLQLNGINDPEIGIILGSGLNDFADQVENPIKIPYENIPHFATGKAEGHRGELVFGELFGKKAIVMAGRFHYYEGGSMDRTVLPARTMLSFPSLKRLIITNAAGCINADWNVGDMMVISDHINMSGTNPLIGANLDEFGPRFPDMTDTYDKKLRAKLKEAALKEGIELREGVYTMMSGPSFETPAEIRFLRTIGSDAVGMSSVPEAIVANHAGREIIGISMLSNMAAGVLDQPLDGAEVTETGIRVHDTFVKVVNLAITV